MKIVFVTFHNWVTKRIGGFHKFAEQAVLDGHDVVFFSFARPYFTALKHEERLNKTVLTSLTKGVKCPIGKDGRYLMNCTWPTLRMPMPFYRYIPKSLNHWLNTHSLQSFATFQDRFLHCTDVFVFESCEGIELFDKIKRFNPNAKYIYRPSDPMMIDGAAETVIAAETHIMLESDYTFIVNQDGLNIYRKRIADFDARVRYSILPNGVNTDMFKVQYKKPQALDKPNTALYVGARVIEWPMITEAAKRCPDINFIIVCPENPPAEFLNSQIPNITYIAGIPPKDVPMWVTNCDVVIVPNPKSWYKVKPWGITAKYYQAMTASKPIVAYEDTDSLKDYGVYVAHSYGEFIDYVREAMNGERQIHYSFTGKDWDVITSEFFDVIKSL